MHLPSFTGLVRYLSICVFAAAASATTPFLNVQVNSSATLGQPVTVIATVVPSSTQGTVRFVDNGVPLGSASLSSGAASFSARLFSTGRHALRAIYDAGANGMVRSDPATVTVSSLRSAGLQAPTTLGPQIPFSIVLADFNGDGYPDAAGLNFTTLSVTLNDTKGGARTAVKTTLSNSATALAAGDLNGDGIPDVVVAYSPAFPGNSAQVMLGNGDGTFRAGAMLGGSLYPHNVVIGDFNGDGKGDVAILGQAQTNGANGITVFLGAGDGTFGPGTSYPELNAGAALVGDFNNDGFGDLAYVSQFSTVIVLKGSSSGALAAGASVSAGASANSLVAADFNEDGFLDLAVPDVLLTHIFYGDGTGNFQPGPLAPNPGSSLFDAGDINGDSHVDLLAASAATLVVQFGNGNGTFRGPLNEGGNTALYFALVTDWNLDGFADAISGADAFSLRLGGTSLATSTTLTLPAATLTQNIINTYAVVVLPPTAGGKVDLLDGGTVLGTGTLDAFGHTSIHVGLIRAGTHSLQASYRGNGAYLASQSPVMPSPVVVPPVGPGAVFDFGVTFSNYFGAGASSFLGADLNGDGWPDLVEANAGGQILVQMNQRNGLFALPNALPGVASACSVAAADWNGDGILDLAVGNCTTPPTVSVLIGKGDGSYWAAVTYASAANPASIVSADLNGDGHPDLIAGDRGTCTAFGDGPIISCTGGGIGVLLNRGDGTFTPAVNYTDEGSVNALAAGDLNGDGKPDVAACVNSNQLSIRLGSSGGTLGASRLIQVAGCSAVAIGDLNGDGRADLAVAGSANVLVLYGNGDGTFQAPVSYGGSANPAYAVNIADVNGDGHPDVIATTASALVLLLGQPGGVLQQVITAYSGNYFAMGDFNHDGSVGLVLAAGAKATPLIGCSYNFAVSDVYFDAPGQSLPPLTVTTSALCPVFTYTADNWARLTTNYSVVTLAVDANTTGFGRTTTGQIAGRNFNITQRATDATFTDVPMSNSFFDAIGIAYGRGIIPECSTSPLLFCPNDPVSRAQMALFVVRTVMGGDNFTFTATPYFTDVPATHPQFKWIQKMRDLHLTSGCTTTSYCPNDLVTRGQTSVFLIRARLGTADTFTYPTIPYFVDVPTAHSFFKWVQKMKQVGITSGCSATQYCPDDSVTRGQMAVFVVRAGLNQLLAQGYPVVASVNPAVGASAGQVLVVSIAGTYTSFVQGVTQVNFGPGITVSNIQVTNGTLFTAQLNVAAGSTPGPRSVVVTTGTEEAVLPNGFTVQ